MKQIIYFTAALFVSLQLHAQDNRFTKEDTLRGSITPERSWWDLTYYHLDVNVKPEDKFISGKVAVHYKVISPRQEMQIDLQPPLTIDKVTQDDESLGFTKKGANAYLITLKKVQKIGSKESISIEYSGNPIVAKNPPWQGGFQWTNDKDGNPFAATSCQGLGASAWWPCKDHMYDEPDSMLISVTVPKNLTDISNGRLRSTIENSDGTKTFHWFVQNPINNYGVNINIANYVHFADTLQGEKGILDLNFYVLPYNLEKAKVQFKQAKMMLKAFEYWFGPYPFYEDGYKLVETPYLGMEHQSSITYGNGYQNGYRGRDLSGTGWGLKWDFIIIHESGHEWFANSITYKDIADMWIHESFTNYSESLFTEYYYGKEAATEYVVGTRKGIRNDKPIIGAYNVNKSGSGDMYPKGGNMLHTIRHSINDDELFREILRGLNKTFYHQTVTTQQIENYISGKAKRNYSKVFDQYLRTTQIPALEYYIERNKVFYRWTNCVKGFDLSLILTNGKTRITPTEKWLQAKLKEAQLFDPSAIEKMYYVKTALVKKD
ncbi:MAG: M1 family metallopeptidase [Bacteroidetes bacterium]|nr:M1 family metallopeptidase [Bacteroidota bacterium]